MTTQPTSESSADVMDVSNFMDTGSLMAMVLGGGTIFEDEPSPSPESPPPSTVIGGHDREQAPEAAQRGHADHHQHAALHEDAFDFTSVPFSSGPTSQSTSGLRKETNELSGLNIGLGSSKDNNFLSLSVETGIDSPRLAASTPSRKPTLTPGFASPGTSTGFPSPDAYQNNDFSLSSHFTPYRPDARSGPTPKQILQKESNHVNFLTRAIRAFSHDEANASAVTDAHMAADTATDTDTGQPTSRAAFEAANDAPPTLVSQAHPSPDVLRRAKNDLKKSSGPPPSPHANMLQTFFGGVVGGTMNANRVRRVGAGLHVGTAVVDSVKTLAGLKNLATGTVAENTKKRGSKHLIDVVAMEKINEEKLKSIRELRSSVAQFRNDLFVDKVGLSVLSASEPGGLKLPGVNRLSAGLYKSKRRNHKGAVIPQDIMEMRHERTVHKNGKEGYISKMTPTTHDAAASLFDWVLDRDSVTYQRFYMFQIFMVLIEAVFLPYQLVFIEQGATREAPYFCHVLHAFTTTAYLFDVWISMHLTYVDDKSETVIDLEMIKHKYFNSYRFSGDVLACIPFDYFTVMGVKVWWWAKYVKTVKIFRLFRLSRLKRLSDNQFMINMGRLGWSLVLFVIIMHVMACMWYQLSLWEENHHPSKRSWMRRRLFQLSLEQCGDELAAGMKGGGGPGGGFRDDDDDDDDECYSELYQKTLKDYECGTDESYGYVLFSDIEECFAPMRRYLISLYTTMMIIIGDGIDPHSEVEFLFSIFGGLFGMIVIAIVIGQTADIIGNLHRAESRYRNKLDDVTEQLKNLNIGKKTSGRVFQYLDYLWTVNRGLNRDVVLKDLSDSLRSEVLVAVHGKVIKKIPFFDIDEIPELLVHVVNKLKSSYYLPGDVIIHEHEKTLKSSCMYFIVHGNVAVYHMKHPDTIIRMISEGDFFGEISFLAKGSRRTASLCAASNSDVAWLRYSDVDELLVLFPELETHMKKEMKKHMAQTSEGKKYLEQEDRMENVTLGSIVRHEKRGEGAVVSVDPFTQARHVKFSDGAIHKYQPTSWHKITLVKQGTKDELPMHGGSARSLGSTKVAAPAKMDRTDLGKARKRSKMWGAVKKKIGSKPNKVEPAPASQLEE